MAGTLINVNPHIWQQITNTSVLGGIRVKEGVVSIFEGTTAPALPITIDTPISDTLASPMAEMAAYSLAAGDQLFMYSELGAKIVITPQEGTL